MTWTSFCLQTATATTQSLTLHLHART